MCSYTVATYLIHSEFMNYFLLGLRSLSESVNMLPPKRTTPSPVTLPPGRCNEHLVGKTGQFSPPDNPYMNTTDCAWVIEVPKGYTVNLIFYDVQIE